MLECEGAEVVFTSGGTESDDFAVKGVAFANGLRGHIVASSFEHSAVLKSLDFLVNLGMTVTYVDPDADGIVSPDAMAHAMQDDTVLCICMLANNEIGTVQPVRDIVARAHTRNIPVFCDAVQGYGQIPVSVADLGVDLLSLSGHKLGAPRGIGILYVKRETNIVPLIDGGGQETGYRSGTENTAGIIGLAQAMSDSAEHRERNAARLRSLSEELFDRLCVLPHCVINGTREHGKRLPGNVNVSFPGLDAESVVLGLDRRGIAASAGAACMGGKIVRSRSLLAIGADDARASSSLRLTLGDESTAEQIRYIADSVAHVTADLYAMR